MSPQVAGLAGSHITGVSRRAKYLLMALDHGSLIWHLGMSGSMRVLPTGSPAANHEHIEFELGNGQSLKFRDPRRFGALLYCDEDPCNIGCCSHLGLNRWQMSSIPTICMVAVAGAVPPSKPLS